MIPTLFTLLVAAHVTTGALGLVLFWVPVVARKGSPLHRRVGGVFSRVMMLTGAFAIGISTCTLLDPLETHPGMTDAALVRAQFGWLMLYLALLTIGLSWHGVMAVRRKQDHGAHRTPLDVTVQVAVIAAALACGWQGIIVDHPLLVGIATVGLFSASVTLWFILTDNHHKTEYLHMHIRSAVGAGISAYTAFLSVALVRILPDHTFNPLLWAAPTLVGSVLIGVHEGRLYAARLRARRRG